MQHYTKREQGARICGCTRGWWVMGDVQELCQAGVLCPALFSVHPLPWERLLFKQCSKGPPPLPGVRWMAQSMKEGKGECMKLLLTLLRQVWHPHVVLWALKEHPGSSGLVLSWWEVASWQSASPFPSVTSECLRTFQRHCTPLTNQTRSYQKHPSLCISYLCPVNVLSFFFFFFFLFPPETRRNI